MMDTLLEVLESAIERTKKAAEVEAAETGQAAVESPQFTMKVLIIYGDEQMRLQGVHVRGEPWLLFEKPYLFTTWQNLENFRALGLELISAVKQPGLCFHWQVAQLYEPQPQPQPKPNWALNQKAPALVAA